MAKLEIRDERDGQQKKQLWQLSDGEFFERRGEYYRVMRRADTLACSPVVDAVIQGTGSYARLEAAEYVTPVEAVLTLVR